MSRWFDRLAEIRSGSATTAAETASPCSKCSNVQSDSRSSADSDDAPGFEQLNILNRGAAYPEAPSEKQHSCDATALLDAYHERAAIRQYDGRYTRDEAERMAWRETASRWYREHGQRVPDHLCAGCGHPVAASKVRTLPYGEAVHADDGDRCLLLYGKRWRHAAARALESIGIPTPADEVNVDE